MKTLSTKNFCYRYIQVKLLRKISCVAIAQFTLLCDSHNFVLSPKRWISNEVHIISFTYKYTHLITYGHWKCINFKKIWDCVNTNFLKHALSFSCMWYDGIRYSNQNFLSFIEILIPTISNYNHRTKSLKSSVAMSPTVGKPSLCLKASRYWHRVRRTSRFKKNRPLSVAFGTGLPFIHHRGGGGWKSSLVASAGMPRQMARTKSRVKITILKMFTLIALETRLISVMRRGLLTVVCRNCNKLSTDPLFVLCYRYLIFAVDTVPTYLDSLGNDKCSMFRESQNK